MKSEAISDIVEDRLGEGIRALENHPDPLSQLDDIDFAGVDILTADPTVARDSDAINQIVHAIETAQES